jgi:lipoprotein NlpI
MRRIDTAAVATVLLLLAVTAGRADEHPLSQKRRVELNEKFDKTIARLTTAIQSAPDEERLYSSRGDAYFFRARFKEAVADYDKVVELNPRRETSHWQRGIAWFYAGQYKRAAHQFEIYNTFDNVDRENGIWRFFSQAKAYGIEKARQGLLKYKKDDREPFPSVYQLFAEKITPREILAQIHKAKIDDNEREKRLFYARLYIGLNYDIHGKPKRAAEHLRAAVANQWGPKAGYGPNYMWHVGRLHYELLRRKLSTP